MKNFRLPILLYLFSTVARSRQDVVGAKKDFRLGIPLEGKEVS